MLCCAEMMKKKHTTVVIPKRTSMRLRKKLRKKHLQNILVAFMQSLPKPVH